MDFWQSNQSGIRSHKFWTKFEFVASNSITKHTTDLWWSCEDRKFGKFSTFSILCAKSRIKSQAKFGKRIFKSSMNSNPKRRLSHYWVLFFFQDAPTMIACKGLMTLEGTEYWFVLTKNHLLSYYLDEKQQKSIGQFLMDEIQDLNQVDERFVKICDETRFSFCL